MKKLLTLILSAIILSSNASAQNSVLTGSEIGVDLAFSGSNFGGNVGLGVKYGLNIGEYIITGPSVRYEQIWWKNYTAGNAAESGTRSVYGGGVFIHGRFFNALFVGAEFELLRSPYDKSGFFGATKTWAPTLFLGGGFSMEFNEKIRFNAGIMYDVINVTNSPFRRSYSVQKKAADGSVAGYLPIIYRIAFFFPIGR